MPDLRILHTNFHKYMVGESKRILANVHGLKKRGHHVVLASPEKSAIITQARDMDLDIFTDVQFASGFNPVGEWRDIMALKKLIGEHRINIVHTHGSKDSWAGALAAWLSPGNVKVARTRHNTYPVKRHVFNRLLYQKLIDRLVVNCNYVKAKFEEGGFVTPERISLIYSGINLQEYNLPDNSKNFRKEFNLSSDHELVGMVAFIIPRKGHRYFIEAAAKVIAARGDKVIFVVVGDGDDSLKCELKHKVAELGLENQIIFTGLRQDVPYILDAMDVFVMPSTDEALAMAITEALSMKKPVVSTTVGGIPDIIKHKKTGLLVPPANSEELARAILTLLADRRLAQTLALNGRKLVENGFSVESMVNKTERLYFELLEENV